MSQLRLRRRALLRTSAAASGVALLGMDDTALTLAQGQRVTASGAGVNLKLMPERTGDPVVPLREPFAFDVAPSSPSPAS